MRHLKLAAIVLVVGLGGCATRAEVRADAYIGSPDLVEVAPGVMVVADWTTPVFFANDLYWSFRDGAWYRSSYYDRGFVRVAQVPAVVARVDRPERFAHYHHTRRAELRRPVDRGHGFAADHGHGRDAERPHRR